MDGDNGAAFCTICFCQRSNLIWFRQAIRVILFYNSRELLSICIMTRFSVAFVAFQLLFLSIFCTVSSIHSRGTHFHANGPNSPAVRTQINVQTLPTTYALRKQEQPSGETVHLDEGSSTIFHAVENVANHTFYQPWPSTLVNPVARLVRTRYDNSGARAHYFLIETLYSDNQFGHWVWESAIFLPSFLEFKRSDPRLHLVLRSKKQYKKLFTDFFGIRQEDVLHIDDLESGKTSVTGRLPSAHNWCVFPPTIALNSFSNETLHSWIPYFDDMIRVIRHRRDPSSRLEPIPFLFLPRQSKENYITNERHVNYTDIYDAVINAGGEVLETDYVGDLTVQINKIQAADVVILDNASSLLFNGLVARNKTLYALGSEIRLDVLPLYRIMLQRIRSDNEYIHVPGELLGPNNYVFTCSMITRLARFCS